MRQSGPDDVPFAVNPITLGQPGAIVTYGLGSDDWVPERAGRARLPRARLDHSGATVARVMLARLGQRGPATGMERPS
jgi:hypothetical protein